MKTGKRGYNTSDLTSPNEIHLKDLVQVVVRHWKIAALFPVLVAGAAFWTSRDNIPIYQSFLKVQISSPKQVFARMDDIDVDEFALRTDPILSEALVLQTQALALRVVTSLGLQLWLADPTDQLDQIFRPRSIRVDSSLAVLDRYELLRGQGRWQLVNSLGTVVSSGTYADSMTGPGFSAWLVPNTEEDPQQTVFDIITPQHAAAFVTGGLGYSVVEQTTAVDISYTGTDPSLVPHILNSAAIELRDMGVDRALEAAQRREEYISSALAAVEIDQQATLNQLQSFRERHQVTNLGAEEEAIITRITSADVERQNLAAYVATLRDAVSGTDSVGIETLNRLSSVTGMATSSAVNFQIRNLLELYDERNRLTAGDLGMSQTNPQVVALEQRIRDAGNALRTAVNSAIETTQSRINALDQQIREHREDLSTFPGMASTIAQIELDLEIKNQTVQYLLGQQQQARMQRATIGPYIQLLDGASPPVSQGTSRNQKIFLGFIVGALLGIGAAFFIEYLDQTIKTSGDIERILGIPVLGMIPDDPSLSTKSDRRQGLQVLDSLDPEDRRAEAFRSLRTNVTFVGAERTLQFIAVTSPGPGEGKSTTAANLAATLGMGGHRTLLIDGDLRRPLLHHAFKLVQEPGLTDVLVGSADAKEAIRPQVAQNLDLLPAGPTPPNPSELLGSDAMRSLINEMRRDYDYIIFDTPPVLPVTDAAVVASNADSTIMVMRAAATEEQAAKRAYDQLVRVHASIAGAVLNGTLQKHDRYQYSYDSYRSSPPTRSKPIRSSIPSKIAGMF